MVEFAKRVPGFLDFHQDDQLILIKLGFYEVWLNYIAKTISDSPISTLTFDDGAFLTRQQLEIMFDVSIFEDFDTCFESAIHKIYDCAETENET